MDTQTFTRYVTTDSAFVPIDGINMGVAVELTTQEAAKRVAALADEEAKVAFCPVMLDKPNEERSVSRQPQQAFRLDDVDGIEAVFVDFGRSMK